MARTNNSKGTKKNGVNLPKDVRALVEENVITLIGKVTKIYRDNNKCVAFGIELYNITSKGNIARAWVNAVSFENIDIEEDAYYTFDGYVSSQNYNGKWSNNFVVNSVEAL